VTDHERETFDALVEEVIKDLPEALRELLEQVPVIVEDSPDDELLEELGEDEDDALLGLHSGTPLTEQSIEDSGQLPPDIHLFREPIVDQAGGWSIPGATGLIREEIRITLLHEIGHQFGLDEDDLDRLGYA